MPITDAVTFDFHLDGHFEFQDVTATLVRPDDGRVHFEFAAHHVCFNAADGSIEEQDTFRERWLGSPVGLAEAGVFLIETISRLDEHGHWQDHVRSRLLGDYGISTGSTLEDQTIVLGDRSFKVERKPRPAAPPDPLQVARDQKRAGWRMGWQKSGEDPDSFPEPDS